MLCGKYDNLNCILTIRIIYAFYMLEYILFSDFSTTFGKNV